jgi:hypothetical protein
MDTNVISLLGRFFEFRFLGKDASVSLMSKAEALDKAELSIRVIQCKGLKNRVKCTKPKH